MVEMVLWDKRYLEEGEWSSIQRGNQIQMHHCQSFIKHCQKSFLVCPYTISSSKLFKKDVSAITAPIFHSLWHIKHNAIAYYTNKNNCHWMTYISADFVFWDTESHTNLKKGEYSDNHESFTFSHFGIKIQKPNNLIEISSMDKLHAQLLSPPIKTWRITLLEVIRHILVFILREQEELKGDVGAV